MFIGRNSLRPAGPIRLCFPNNCGKRADRGLIVRQQIPPRLNRPRAEPLAQWLLTIARKRSTSASLVSKEQTSRRKASSSRGASAGATARERPFVERRRPRARSAATSERGAIGNISLTCRRPGEAHAGNAARPSASPPAARLARRGERQPKPVFEIGRHLRAEKAALRQRMAAALALEGEIRRLFGIEEDHRLAAHRAVFCGAERQDVDAGAPGHLRRRAAERDQRIGETRAVHMHGDAGAMGDRRQGGDLVGRIDRAGFGRLRQRQARRAAPT